MSITPNPRPHLQLICASSSRVHRHFPLEDVLRVHSCLCANTRVKSMLWNRTGSKAIRPVVWIWVTVSPFDIAKHPHDHDFSLLGDGQSMVAENRLKNFGFKSRLSPRRHTKCIYRMIHLNIEPYLVKPKLWTPTTSFETQALKHERQVVLGVSGPKF